MRKRKFVIQASRDSSFKTFDVTTSATNEVMKGWDGKSFVDIARQCSTIEPHSAKGTIITVADRKGNTRSYEVIRKGAVRDVTGDTYEERQAMGASTSAKRRFTVTASKKSVKTASVKRKAIQAAKIEDWGDGPVKVFWKSGKWSIIMDGYGLGITDGWGVERPIIYTHKNPPTVAYDGTAVSVPPYVKRKFEELVRKGVLKNRSDLYESGEWDTYFNASTSTKRRSVKAARKPYNIPSLTESLRADYDNGVLTIEEVAEELAKANRIPHKGDIERAKIAIGLEPRPAIRSASTSTKRKSVKAACGKKSVKSASRPVTQEYITEEFVEKANDDYLTTAYENNNLTVILIEGSDLVILADGPNHGEIEKRAKEIAEEIYPQYGVIGDYKDLREKGYSDAPVGSAVKCSTLDERRDAREELSETYYITYNGKIIVETDGTGDAGAEALREVFAMDADALDAAAKYLNSFGDDLVYNKSETRDDGSVEYWIDDDGEWDADDVAITLAQFIQMEYDEGQMDPTYFGSEIYWDGGRIEWFDAADLADDVNSSTDITAARRDTTIDKEAVRELVLYITNDGDLYRQRVTPMIENLKRKVKKGTYDREKAVKLWQYLADDGVKKYGKEFGPGASVAWLNPATREEIARELRDCYEEEVMWDQNHPVEASTYMIVPDSGTVPFDSDIIDILAYYGYSTLEDFATANGIRDFVKAKQILLERYAEDTESGYPSSLWDGKSENEIYADLPEAGLIDDDTPYL